MIPETEQIADREGGNRCDWFQVREEKKDLKDDSSDAARRLFGDEEEPPSPTSLDDLFKQE